MHILIEHRVMPTELDKVIRSLKGHEASTLAYAAGVLFRAGLRLPDEARKLGLAGLLAIPRLGARSVPVIRDLCDQLQVKRSGATKSTNMAQARQPE